MKFLALAVICLFATVAYAGYSKSYFRSGHKTYLGGAGYGYRPVHYAARHYSKPVVYAHKPVVYAHKPAVHVVHKPVVYHHAKPDVHYVKPAVHYAKPAYHYQAPHGVVHINKPSYYLGGHVPHGVVYKAPVYGGHYGHAAAYKGYHHY